MGTLYFSSLSLLCTALHYLNAWNRLTVVPHGEQTALVEKDSPSSRTTKSSFFSRSAHFGNVSRFLVGATNAFSELIHPFVKLPNCVLKQQPHILLQFICPKPSALSAFSLFEEQAQALLSYFHFHSFLILHYIYYISLYTLQFTGKQR